MLRIEAISKTFDKGTINEKKALSNLSLNVFDRDFITIIGANGAGKTTLFNAIRGKFLTDTGRIVLGGEDITMKPDHRRARDIGIIFQDPMLGTAPGMTIEENLYIAAGKGRWYSRITKKERERFRERLSLLDMGLEDRLSQPVGLLSGGQRQALSLLMSTINRPKLLLLDEHTAALDPQAAEKVLELTVSIVREEELTCLMITHNMQSALDIGNRTIMMDGGRIIFDTEGEERKALSVADLVMKFRDISGSELRTDRMLLSM